MLEIDPNNFRAKAGLNNALSVKQAKEEEQQQAQARRSLQQAEAAMKKGDYLAAIAAYESALKLQPGNQQLQAALQKARDARRAECEIIGCED